MTRGRGSNHPYVVVEDNQTARDVLTQAITRDWIDQPAVVRKAQLDPHLSRQLDPSGLNEEAEFARLERHVRRLMEERRARTRQVVRSMSRALDR
jgi:hypothetical protein